MRWTLEELTTKQQQEQNMYTEFLRQPDISAGLYTLAAGATDTQSPHTEDEIYVVLAGSAKIKIAEQVFLARTGDTIFVPANVPHKFFDIVEELKLIVVFGPAEHSRAKNTI